MNNIEQLLQEVKTELYNENLVIEYFRLKEIIEKDSEINNLSKEVNFHQRKMCENKNNDEIYFKEKTLYEEALNKLENSPIYINFQEVKSEINKLLIDIRDFLS